MKTTKKILTLVLALALIFALAAPTFAFVDGDDGSYPQDPISTIPAISGEFTTYVSFYSYTYKYYNGTVTYQIKREKLPVTMGSPEGSAKYTVRDLLVATHAQYPAITFYEDANNTVLSSTSDRLYGIKDTTAHFSHVFATQLSIRDGYNGWMFRIDGKYPILDSADWPDDWDASQGDCGAKIHEAYLTTAGQHVCFFFADVKSATYATKTTCYNSISYDSDQDKLSLEAVASYSWYDSLANNYLWHIFDYALYKNKAVSVKVNGNIYDANTNSSGIATFNNVVLSPGTYTVEVYPTVKEYTIGNYIYGIPKTIQYESYTLTVS